MEPCLLWTEAGRSDSLPLGVSAGAEGRARQAASALPESQDRGRAVGRPHQSPHSRTFTMELIPKVFFLLTNIPVT